MAKVKQRKDSKGRVLQKGESQRKIDVITPKAVEYDYKLLFEDRTISVLTCAEAYPGNSNNIKSY